MRALHCQAHVVGWRRQFGAHVKRHLDVRRQSALRLNGVLRGQPDLRAVIHRPKRDAIVVHTGLGLTAARGSSRAWSATQRHHLKSARIGEEVAAPAREPFKAAERSNGFDTRTQHEVVRVGQHNFESQRFVVAGIEMDYGASGAHRHEHGRLERSSRCGHLPPSGCAIGCEQLERDRWNRRRCPLAHGRPPLSSSMASPNDRKR